MVCVIHGDVAKSRVRFSLELSGRSNEVLEGLAKVTGSTKTEIIRKAVAFLEVAFDAKEKGNFLAVVDSKNRVISLIVGL
jgi:predicted DNA-binding protein